MDDLTEIIRAGIEHLQNGDSAAALGEFRRACQLAPTNPIPHYNLGVVHLDLGQPELAQGELEEAARLDPDNAWIYINLARAYEQRKDEGGQHEALEIAAQLSQEVGLRCVALGKLADARGDLDAALQHYRRAHEYGVTRFDSLGLVGHALLRLKRYTEAREILLLAPPKVLASRHPSCSIWGRLKQP